MKRMAISQAKKLEIITKHGKQFASRNGGSTPILEGVHYAADGSVIVTDRHKLIRIGGAHTFAEPFTSHVVTGALIEGKYPDTSRIIPMELKSQIALLTVTNRADVQDAIARMKLAVDIAKVARDKSVIATLAYVGSSVNLRVSNDNPTLSFSAGISGDIYGPDETVSFNAEYMLAALNVFKDAGSKRVIIGLTGAASPIVLRDEENEIDAIVLPYRRAAA